MSANSIPPLRFDYTTWEAGTSITLPSPFVIAKLIAAK